MLSVVVMVLFVTTPTPAVVSGGGGRVWWDPWTWMDAKWKPISGGLNVTEIREEGASTVAQYNYKIDYVPEEVVRFVSVDGGEYRDVDEKRREFKLTILGIGNDVMYHVYDARVVRIVPETPGELIGTVSDKYIYVVFKFQKM